ncbi:MAG: site-2 protease family protein [Oscillospiraceae bacterium]|jgi:Zn-dependent protease|nr:site-2 protease family protein [Oscillospiraceae bacterium]
MRLGEIFSGDWLREAAGRVIPILICITFHELAHGFVAYKLGDRTAKDMGRLTLNPIRHIDPIGCLMMLLTGFGWAKPVPVNMGAFRDPKKGMALTALAGPASNIALAVPVLFIYGALRSFPALYGTSFGKFVTDMTLGTAYVSVALAVFNMIPIPPLDGSKALFALASSDRQYYMLMRYERYGMILLVAVMYLGILSGPVQSVTSALFGGLFKVAEASAFIFGRLLRTG